MPYREQRIPSVDCDRDFMVCTYEEPIECPACHHALVPQFLDGHFVKHEGGIMGYSRTSYIVYISFFCPRCRQVFLVEYATYEERANALKTSQILGFYPLSNENLLFSQPISNLSQMFVTTYSQSKLAENNQLSEVAGCGYRKSVEYLVKDYLVHKFPQEEKEIKSEFLGVVIKRIEDSRIKTLAERATWLGNDETHYVRKHEDLDIQDMKRFITAMLHYIEAELTLEDALAVTFKK